MNAPTNSKGLISFVLPIFNESSNIERLHEELSIVLSKVNYSVELIFVDDGSDDDSARLLLNLAARDERVTVVEFARNFGHQIAVTAGLDIARGDAVIVMDSDLQDPPRVALELIAEWEEGWEVVYAQRRTRKDSAFKKLTASIFYRMLRLVAEVDIPPNTGDFRLLDRKVVDELKKYRERDRFLRGLVSYIGFKQRAVLFDRDERFAGETGYSLKKMFELAGNGIMGFSTFPLRVITRIGYLSAGLSFIGILYAAAVKVFFPAAAVEGWTFLVLAVLFVGGMQLVMLGIVGGYVGRIYREVQQRPLYSVRQLTAPGLRPAGTESE